jgi:antitoxin FitA
MSAITINLSEERMRQLREVAARLGVSPEDLARVSIEELLTKPDEKFEEAARHVLDKNAELYRRLA